MFLQNYSLVFLLIALLPRNNCFQLQEEEISRWANELGKELWNLGRTITRFMEIEASYHYLNAQVEIKDPQEVLKGVVKDIETMMDRKMDSIVCIVNKAEEVAETFVFNDTKPIPPYTYYSSKYSNISMKDIEQATELFFDSIISNMDMYQIMVLNNDTHFYNLPVNTTHSSVHVPTNIYDRHPEAAFAIQWSEALDEVFVQNYNSDPALSWQYFGSSAGIMRHYPAKRWEETKKDLFDCRIRTWYIEAATCTKDVIILIDNSGSMDGMGRHIAALTAYSILDTFSNNDFINVLYYNLTTNYTIPCFEDMLVQATEENISLFKQAIQTLKPNGKTKVSQALETSFGILEKYRNLRGCNSSETMKECNQAIMVITDGIAGNLSDVVIKFNYFNDGLNIPVRLFTYLIGQEVSNVEEIKWMACANRGYYTPVQTLEQVTASVLQYINVIARPLVLHGSHPVSWTHAYADLTYDDKNDMVINEPYRLLTSAAVPAFNTKTNKDNDTRKADLLGVAGTDVPIADIEKLTLPYKIGVNAYAFIVSNNGYVLMHRDLRPVFEDMLTVNYNSIDLTEVELLDDDLPPRQIGETLKSLREALVNGEWGSNLNITVKYHYDKMRRIAKQTYDYFHEPIEGTPFSIAFAIPHGYGNYSLQVGDEIAKNRHTGADITDFFKGSNWKIHPKWVYCKYHYLEGHEFATPEEELLHFLSKMYDPDFKWEKQYYEENEEEKLEKVECGRKTHGDDDYYCDKQLVQRLVFDAKNTLEAFGQSAWMYNAGEDVIFERFNANLRFVATMSGLTRWQYISEPAGSTKKEKHFEANHMKAIDETWYRSAVFQHRYDSESMVYSVPFDSGGREDLVVTGSYAIFPSDAGREAPGSVVGFQFSHKNLKDRFDQLFTKVSNQCPECGTCNTTLECYIIDNNGYIIVSGNNNNDSGKFFGEIEGDVLESMVEKNVFEKITVYDYQSLCNSDDDMELSSGNIIQTPLDYLVMILEYCFVRLASIIFEVNLCNLPIFAYAQDSSSNSTQEVFVNDDDDDDEDKYYACDKERDLYILQQQQFLHDNFPVGISSSRPYYIKKIPHSNLLFVAINSTMPRQFSINFSTSPRKIEYENDTVYPCQKLDLNNLTRRRLKGCFNEHPLESEIKTCGESSTISISFAALLANLLLNRYNLYLLL